MTDVMMYDVDFQDLKPQRLETGLSECQDIFWTWCFSVGHWESDWSRRVSFAEPWDCEGWFIDNDIPVESICVYGKNRRFSEPIRGYHYWCYLEEMRNWFALKFEGFAFADRVGTKVIPQWVVSISYEQCSQEDELVLSFVKGFGAEMFAVIHD